MTSLIFFVAFAINVNTIVLNEINSEKDEEKVELWSYENLDAYIKADSRKMKVINFWATWCKPCIKEMPYFESVATQYSDSVELLFVSIDFADQLENKVLPFLEKKGIKSKVVLLDDQNYDTWINKVSSEWSGAIPATLLVGGLNKDKKEFYEQEFTRDQLERTINKFLKN